MVLENLFCVLLAKLPFTGCQLVGNLFEAHKQVLNKSTRLIALKFSYEVLLEMATECLGFEKYVAIFVAMVAILNCITLWPNGLCYSTWLLLHPK